MGLWEGPRRLTNAGGWLLVACLLLTAQGMGRAGEGENLIPNGDLAQGLQGWSALWLRDSGQGEARLEAVGAQPATGLPEELTGKAAVRIVHRGEQDWSFSPELTLPVRPGEIFELSGWCQADGPGEVLLAVITRSGGNQVRNWHYGSVMAGGAHGWQRYFSRFIIPAGVVSIQPRWTGDRPQALRVAQTALRRAGSIRDNVPQLPPQSLSLRNEQLDVTFEPAAALLQIHDRRNGRVWRQQPEQDAFIVLAAQAKDNTLSLTLLSGETMLQFSATIRIEPDRPELLCTLFTDDARPLPLQRLDWPGPFASAPGELLILPVNEGISYPVDDVSLPSMHYHLYGGHGLCMPWYGAVSSDDAKAAGWQAIVETADDAYLLLERKDGLLRAAPRWVGRQGLFASARRIRYVLHESGGYVALAKRYREYAKSTGLLVALAQKRERNPDVDRLVGAANIWCWDSEPVSICRELQAAGMARILWSNASSPEALRQMNELGVLTSRYDIYQDAMNPEEFPKLRWLHPDWTSDAWKNGDILLNQQGAWEHGWEVETKDGGMTPCGVLCDRQALPYARSRIPADLATHPYRCRFTDTTTASSWRECYAPKHPMTRSECKQSRMELLRYVSDECRLVCGSETGHDAAVPYVHYFEGMLSLGPYRLPDSGRQMQRIVEEVPEKLAKFQTGHFYRLPLWELVYHDCVIAQWYWGDYNNKLPAVWPRRDLWNALYGTPPMYMFDRALWRKESARFAGSYRTAEPVSRATGYSEMVGHEWLTPDHAVQRTRFANGVTVLANFGATAFALPDGGQLPPLSHRAENLPAE